MASKPMNPIIRELMDLIESPDHGNVARPTSQFGHVRDKGTSPHGGFDQNRGPGVPGPVNSPVFGKIGEVGGPLGKIVIHEVDPVTGAPTGYDIEILHTGSQFVTKGDMVSPRQAIGMQGGVGVNGVDKITKQGIPGPPHAHIQVYEGTDPTPLNPLRHLYEYHHPDQPIPTLPEFFPESVPARPGSPSRHDPRLGDDPPVPDTRVDGRGPAASNRQPPTLPSTRLAPAPTVMPRSNVGPPLDLTPPEFRNPPATGGEFAPPHDPTGSLYFSPEPSLRQFGPFSAPGPFSSGTDILRPRTGSFGNSPISALSAPSHVGNGSVPAAVPQPISGNTADQAGGFSDVGGPPLSQISQAGAVVPTYPDRHDAGDWPPQALPSSVQTQPTPQPAQPVQNLTTRVLRMKGVPEADIGAAISSPAKMQELLNQLYGRRSRTAAEQDSTQASSADQPDQASGAATPPNYLPFGWAGLQALLR